MTKAEQILKAVSAELDVDAVALARSKSRGRKCSADARRLSYLLIRELTPMSLPEIGALFGRDHTTVLQMVRKTRRDIEFDRRLREVYERVRGRFSGPLQELEWINAEIHRLRARAEALVAAATVAA